MGDKERDDGAGHITQSREGEDNGEEP